MAKTGRDTNPGTQARPWLTISKAAATLRPGDTVFIKRGVYNEEVSPKNSGTPGRFITYTSFQTDRVILDGQQKLPESDEHWGGLFYLSGKKYIIVRGLKVINSNGAGFMAEDNCSNLMFQQNSTFNTFSSGIGIWNCQNIILNGNSIQRACQGTGNVAVQECLSVSNTKNFEVKNNQVFDRKIGALGSGGEGICIKEACRNGRVFQNVVYDLALLGIYVDGWASHLENVEVFNNTVFKTRDGIVIAAETKKGSLRNVKVYNNIVYDNTFNGISISDNNSEAPDGGDGPKEDITVTYNTVFHNGHNDQSWGGGISVFSKNPANKRFVVANNICSQNFSWQIVMSQVNAGKTLIKNNLIDGPNDYQDGGDQGIDGKGAIKGDPLFQNPDARDFIFLPTSPAIDAGTSDFFPRMDFFGRPRPYDGNGDGKAVPDLGAIERSR